VECLLNQARPKTTITADYVLAQFPELTSVAEAKTRIQDILSSAKELGTEDAVNVMLAYALYNGGAWIMTTRYCRPPRPSVATLAA
jgi:hypothetical protein